MDSDEYDEEEETLSVKQEQKFNSKEGEEVGTEEEEQQEYNSKEEEISGKAPRTCNSMFGCGRCFCEQCYPAGDALGRQ